MGKRLTQRTAGTAATVATVLLGWVLVFPVHTPGVLVRWSYDLLQLAMPPQVHVAPVIIHMDEQAMRDYGQKPGQPWDRALHARLLERLTLDRPSVVVFDVMLTQEGDADADRRLAAAIGQNGRVVLAADRVPMPGQRGYTLVPPLELFETNAASWGIAKIHLDPDRVGRRYDAGDEQEPGLAWAAAVVAGAITTREPERRLQEDRWLNYHGTAHPFEATSMTYSNAETREPGFFAGKAVFIGGKPETPLRGEITDVFATPFTRWTGEFVPGVEITAIAFSNLLHDDSLRRVGLFTELALLCLSGLLLGWGLHWLQRRRAVGLAAVFMTLLGVVAVVLALRSHLWFAWGIVAFAQVPCAVAFRLFSDRHSALPVAAMSGPVPAGPEVGVPDASVPGRISLEIPDHVMIRCIGEGAYGQVWVARNAIGLHHAVKVVYKSRFGIEGPYQRALHGIQKFMPVSRSHQGFVHILHVGRNEAAGYFFYIMEAGDDQKTGRQIDPASYAPRTLSSELQHRGMLPPRECLAFMLALTEAVHELHQHRLIHRDIKPANILFVNGRPKLADIDLVTDISHLGDVSRIGTEGYIAPEGPGTAAADVFSLGRILYVALTGKPPGHCPDLPTRIASEPDCALILELSQIACKACDSDLGRRYASAALMRAELLRIFNRLDT